MYVTMVLAKLSFVYLKTSPLLRNGSCCSWYIRKLSHCSSKELLSLGYDDRIICRVQIEYEASVSHPEPRTGIEWQRWGEGSHGRF